MISITRAGIMILVLLIAGQQPVTALADTDDSAAKNITIKHDFIGEELNELDNWGGLVRIDETSKQFMFDEGLSPYQVVKLPAVTTPYIMRAELTYPGVRDNGILWASVLLLDSTGNVIGKVVTPKDKEGKLLTLSSRIKVEIDPAEVFFVVFYSNSADIGKMTSVAWTRVNDTLYAETRFSQFGELQIYLVKSTTKCRFSSNLEKCQPQ
jgi:hypothetical protein